jgi:GMP synthase-like glutamine amidotransferase
MTAMRIQVLQHVPFEGPGAIGRWAEARGHPLAVTEAWREAMPGVGSFDALVVMGGPMGVHDEADLPWLRGEKALIRAAIAADRMVVGVCLGAQLMADVLGARVYRNTHREIGWLPVDLTPAARAPGLFDGLPDRPVVFQWHGDTFDLPVGAAHLASSEGCRAQAFLAGRRALALQFHFESTEGGVESLLVHCAGEMTPGPYVQDAATIRAATAEGVRRTNAWLFTVLDRLAAV